MEIVEKLIKHNFKNRVLIFLQQGETRTMLQLQ